MPIPLYLSGFLRANLYLFLLQMKYMNLFKNAYDYHNRSEHPTGTSIRLWAEVLVHHCRFHIADPASFPYLEACSVVFRGFPRGSNLRKSWVHVSLFIFIFLVPVSDYVL